MSLSEHERRQLDDIERWLVEDDPVLAHDLGAPRRRPRPWGLVIGMIMLVGGIALLVVGTVLAMVPVLVIGLFSSMLFPVPMQLDAHWRDQAR